MIRLGNFLPLDQIDLGNHPILPQILHSPVRDNLYEHFVMFV